MKAAINLVGYVGVDQFTRTAETENCPYARRTDIARNCGNRYKLALCFSKHAACNESIQDHHGEGVVAGAGLAASASRAILLCWTPPSRTDPILLAEMAKLDPLQSFFSAIKHVHFDLCGQISIRRYSFQPRSQGFWSAIWILEND